VIKIEGYSPDEILSLHIFESNVGQYLSLQKIRHHESAGASLSFELGESQLLVALPPFLTAHFWRVHGLPSCALLMSRMTQSLLQNCC
jgi:hypothetical protein